MILLNSSMKKGLLITLILIIFFFFPKGIQAETNIKLDGYEFEDINYEWNIEKELRYLEDKKDAELAGDLSLFFSPLGLVYAEANLLDIVIHTGAELMSSVAVNSYLSSGDMDYFDFIGICVFAITKLNARSLAKKEVELNNARLKNKIKIDTNFNNNESFDIRIENKY